MVFVDLRDRSGKIQLSFGPEWSSAETMVLAGHLSAEDVITVTGLVARRPEAAVNPELATGEIEVRVERLERISAAEPLPIPVAISPEESLPAEELRLRHRVLDLRRPELLRNFEVRHRVVAAARAALDAEGFLEVETPLLTRRTPEGARDYLVPSRLHRGHFYALPQSPQIYKQLLMVAGFDRYYQVARCLRDEDLRADRQPEFTQIDVEMSFVEQDDVLAVCEAMLACAWRAGTDTELPVPFPRLSYAEAMERYGTDKPDLRVGWTLRDFSPLLVGKGFRVADAVVETGGRVRGFVGKGGATCSRKRLDEFAELARENGARGMLWIKRAGDAWSGAPAKFLSDTDRERLSAEFGVEEGDLVVLVAGSDADTSRALAALRGHVARTVGAAVEGPRPLWVLDFPLFAPDEATGSPTASHHPFTQPAGASPEEIVRDPLSVRAQAYDAVIDGSEMCSGSLRCHDAVVQRAIFEVLGFSPAEIEARFGFLLDAFRYGVPPHGGFAVGVDRLVAAMVGAASIRDVIAFPKTTAARGLLEGSPAPVGEEELAALGLAVRDGAAPRSTPSATPPAPGE